MLCGLSAEESYSQTVRISLNMENSTIKEILKGIENRSEFTFYYNDDIIDVDKRLTLNAENLSISDKNIIITAREAGISQQGKTITGIVRDTKGDPVIGANVSVKGTTNGTITDLDGKFVLDGVTANSVLSISYIGYIAQEITMGNKNSFDVVLRGY